ncbi:alpha/beta hydrolase family protein [Gayadomonas joobiniege]|uniref:alpha/beta hydrolase family protein n=1 Tax=Gayadomonas joobiniege TaxID=1234606 RepID=UPI000378C656|nr:alpha/beta fold hydrolase [Gayadomonas joobiniege]
MLKYLFRVLLLFLPLGTFFVAANTPPVSAYSYLPETSMVRLSPSAKYISFRYVKNDDNFILVKDLKTGKVVGGINIGELNPKNAYFIDDNQILLVASEYRSIYGFEGRENISTAFIYNIKNKELRQLLIPGYGIYPGQTGLGRLIGISPDKAYAYMPAYVGERHETPRFDLLKVNLNQKRMPRRHAGGTRDTIDFFINDKGEPLARERFNQKRNLHIIEAMHDGRWISIFELETQYRTHSFVGLTKDYQSLVFIAGHQDNSAYYTMSLKDGTISTPYFAKKGRTITRVLTDLKRVVYGVEYGGLKPSYEFFDKKISQTIAGLQAEFQSNSVYLTDYSQDWSKLIFYLEGNEFAGDYILISGKQAVHLSASRPKIPSQLINPVSIGEYKAADGLTIPALITEPVKKSDKKYPLIVLPHGGPETNDKFGFDDIAQFLASRGYLVIQPQFRGSTGFGARFINLGYGEWGRKMQSDLNDAIPYAVDHFNADANKVCIMGWSYGGYAALSAAAFNSGLYKCAISINGVSDLTAMLAYEEDKHGEDHEITEYWQQAIQNDRYSEDDLDQLSPINFVADINIPVLLFHGEDDTVVPFEQSEDIYDELEDMDKTVEFIELEDEGHSILNNNASRYVVLKKVESFLQAHL